MLKKSLLLLGGCTVLFGGLACSKRPSPPPPETPGVYIDDASVKEGAAGTTSQLTFNLRLSPTRDGEVTVDYLVQVPTAGDAQLKATADDDYSGPHSGRVSFPAGASSATITVPVTGDDIYERNELLAVQLSGANGADIQRATAVGTITNDDAAPTISLAPAAGDVVTVAEVAKATRQFRVTLTGQTALPLSFGLSFADVTAHPGVATYYVDYVVSQDDQRHIRHRPVSIAADSNPKTASRTLDYTLEVVNDGVVESNETVVVAVITPIDAKLGTGVQLNWTIPANDTIPVSTARKLNDTGITQKATGTDAPTTGKQDPEVGSDAVPGLDATGEKAKGFGFTKLDSNGAPLTDQAAAYSTSNKWSCVRDDTTGLVWEMRPDSNEGIHAGSLFTTWYDPDASTNGGEEGVRGANEDCRAGTLSLECNTATIAAETNLEALCGMTGWRLPTLEELRSVVDYGVKDNQTYYYDRSIFTGYFLYPIWTSSSTTSNIPNKATLAKTIQLRYGIYREEPIAKNSIDAQVGIWLVNDGLR